MNIEITRGNRQTRTPIISKYRITAFPHTHVIRNVCFIDRINIHMVHTYRVYDTIYYKRRLAISYENIQYTKFESFKYFGR